MKYENIREEELKNKIASDYFWLHDCTKIMGNVDFCVCIYQSKKELFEIESLLWAEAKKGVADITKSIVQLILTIGKERTFDKFLPPAYLGAFDSEKIAFIPYDEVSDIFYENDFNWKVAPSNYDTKEFKIILNIIKKNLDEQALIYDYEKNDSELKQFIKDNFLSGKYGTSKTKIDKNNFMVIYNKWLEAVQPTILVNWDIVKKNGIIDGDFYLADLLSQENKTLKDKLFVLLKTNHYELDKKIEKSGLFSTTNAEFKDNQKAHTQFWNKYDRPPKEEYWDYIVERRDLLVPQDIRERKGSFFTPQIWVELSQKYLTDTLGENWQDEYYIWDCAAGTGNLLAGLTNKYNIWASTLDRQDVDVIKDRIKNGANLLEDHVFQFDFLNGDFSTLPEPLQDIIKDPEKQKKLVIYINPPYAEATSAKTVSNTGKNKSGVSTGHTINEYFNSKIGNASNEIFALFMAQVYEKIPCAILGQFSKLKFIQGTNFIKFKEYFLAKYLGGFIVPANSFDNVQGSFPIGFTLWDLGIKKKIKTISCTIYYNNNKEHLGIKKFYGNLPESINKWIVNFNVNMTMEIGLMVSCPPDIQHNKQLAILSKEQERYCFQISIYNLIPIVIYYAVRHCIKATWINDRDQFLYPNDGWQTDTEFQNDCLAYTLFHGQNRISNKYGINHWIPFTAKDVNAKDNFKSNFMVEYIQGTLKIKHNEPLFKDNNKQRSTPLKFSPQAQDVFNAGLKLWIYYHSQSQCNINASLYDIKEHFQGRNKKGKMNNKSEDETYTQLIAVLREALKNLAQEIEPKIYEYGFLTE